MKNDIEDKLTFRKHSGGQDYYDCPKCTIKDPTGTLVVNWDKETFVCNHMDTCGFSGHIVELAQVLDVKTPRRNDFKAPYRQKEVKKVYEVNKVNIEPVQADTEIIEINFHDRMKQLESLFNPDDKLIVCRNANYGETLDANIVTLDVENDNYTHFKVNAGGPKAEDIKTFNYTLIECDNIEDLTEQKRLMLGLDLPIASLTWSGNKSLHAVVKIQAPDIKEYKRRVTLLHEVCNSVGFHVDKTKDPCRYTRLAGAINPKTNKVQKLLGLDMGAPNWHEWESYHLPRLEKTANTLNTGSINSSHVTSGFSSGFLTHDYNDSGLKAGGLTLLTGRRNQGKTTFARQIMIATAIQELSVFAYMGEGDIGREKGYLERLVAKKGEITSTDNGFGRTDWFANEHAKARYNKDFAQYIDFYDKPLNLEGYVFDSLMQDMRIKAQHGSVLFVIDNMMKLTADQPDSLKAQKLIITKLKEFAVNYQVHIILICHPSKAGLSVSGAQEQENTADTILKFQRCMAGGDSEHLPQAEMDYVTAMVYNEKVRDGGEDNPLYMEFDPVRQANIEIVYKPELYQRAKDYNKTGFFSREVIRIN